MGYYDQLGKTESYKYIEVTNEEIIAFDRMIYSIIHEHLFKGWLSSLEIRLACSGDNMIRNTGFTLEDFFQIGRWIVFEQIRWYKKNGDKEKYGASMETLVYQQLAYRFINLKNSLTAKKRGGRIPPSFFVNYDKHYSQGEEI